MVLVLLYANIKRLIDLLYAGIFFPIVIEFQYVCPFLAARSSSRSTVVRPSVRRSVGPSVFVKE